MTDRPPSDYERHAATGTLGEFGQYVMTTAFDPALRSARGVLDGNAAAPQDQRVHERLGRLSDEERDAVADLVRTSVTGALHGLLHGLSHDEDRIRLLWRDEDVAEQSDGLHGDLLIWIRDISAFPHDWEADSPPLG